MPTSIVPKTVDLSSKTVAPQRAFKRIPRGARIFLGSGAAAPLALIRAMEEHPEHFVDHEVTSLLTLGDAPWVAPEQQHRFRHNALFIGPNVRHAVEAGRADYTPMFLSEIPALFKSGDMPIQVAMIQVAPPKDGMCSLGASVDVVKAAAEEADLVIAEINAQAPRTFGDSMMACEDIDFFVHSDYPLPELPRKKATAETMRIGGHIAKLVDDGSVIQAGIGAIPDAALAMLGSKKNLGVHTEMMSDGYIDLIESGVLNNRFKQIHTGKSVTSFLLGSRRLYNFAHERTDLEMYPCDHTNDPFVIAQNDKMVAINTAIEIDLTGQVCADSIGSVFYSGIGGQVDFIRGAARSKGGRPIIAIPSTAKNGTISRIKPRLARGGGVVTTRGDVHFVVTEWGIASLHGKTIRERAMALIEIAHPRFRPWLLAEAKEHHYVYADQTDPMMTCPVYPDELESFILDRNNRQLLVRPVRPSDEETMHDMFYQLSDESLYQRFFSYTKSVTHGALQPICNVDYERTLTLVVCIGASGREQILGLARYIFDENTQYAEVEFVVLDAWQHRGIGSKLVNRLADIARQKGIKGFTADVLSTNQPMLRLLQKLEGQTTEASSDGVTQVRVTFPAA